VPGETFPPTLPHATAIACVLVTVTTDNGKGLDDVRPLLVSDLVVNLYAPQNSVGSRTIWVIREGSVSSPRDESEVGIELAQGLRVNRALIDVDGDDRLSTPTVALFAGFHKVVTIKQATIPSMTSRSNLVKERFLIYITP